jgi:hypothetical protein
MRVLRMVSVWNQTKSLSCIVMLNLKRVKIKLLMMTMRTPMRGQVPDEVTDTCWMR